MHSSAVSSKGILKGNRLQCFKSGVFRHSEANKGQKDVKILPVGESKLTSALASSSLPDCRRSSECENSATWPGLMRMFVECLLPSGATSAPPNQSEEPLSRNVLMQCASSV
eukprot:1147659-Pelagomonas_calceolata.AAC.2